MDSDHIMLLAGICGYFAIMILIGYLMKDRNKGADDFLVGGRSFGVPLNSAALTAAWVGGLLIIGVPGVVYTDGIWNSETMWGNIVTIGGNFCLLFAALFYMRRLWQLKLMSLGDFYYLRFGRNAGILATVILCFSFILWVSVQIVSFAKVGVTLVGMSLNTWIIISMAVICTYTILGGLWAVSVTDIVQVVIVIACTLILTPVAIHMVGGWGAFIDAIPAEKLEFFPQDVGSFHAWGAWIAAWLIVGLGSIASPDLMQRAFCAKSGRTAKQSAIVAFILVNIITIIVFLLSFAAIQMLDAGTIDLAMIDEDPELLLPLTFQALMPLPLVILFLGAVMAAVMSAAATSNIALAGVISKNLIKDIFLPKMSSYGLMQLTRGIVLAVALLAAYIGIALPSAFLLTSLGFDLVFSCLFIPLTLGLYWNKANGWGALAGMAAGALVRVVGSGLINGFTLEGIGSPTDTWYYFTLGGPAVSLLAMVVVSLLTQRNDPPLALKLEQDTSK